MVISFKYKIHLLSHVSTRHRNMREKHSSRVHPFIPVTFFFFFFLEVRRTRKSLPQVWGDLRGGNITTLFPSTFLPSPPPPPSLLIPSSGTWYGQCLAVESCWQRSWKKQNNYKDLGNWNTVCRLTHFCG